MRLTQQTDIALRILMYLAVHPDEKTIIDDVVTGCMCPRPQAVKAIQSLRNAGIVTSRKGRNGGIALARDPADVYVGEVVRTIETDMTIAKCLSNENANCNVTDICLLKGVFSGALVQFMDYLDSKSIADITRNKDELYAAQRRPKRSVQLMEMYTNDRRHAV